MSALSVARAVALGVGVLALSGCITKIAESRVESALVKGGLSQANSECMAERMVDRLSISQLRKLERLKGEKGEPLKPVTIRGYIERVRRVGDAEVIAVTSSSAVVCAAKNL
ncbi:hypothetical protein [Pontixanthobacter aquaemixtae]|uniref:Uncharacterized protein n=1 Tax=Pontixanthobacter aquaemixtae TaxID=1958940 RepID=A0A844ZS60_9SPHN|nr:hypothetical protein [Pontixanthobacter aquaemixtae]MXO89647.1 hypothetical protein [Pontixanthobacter aquaemixtae]